VVTGDLVASRRLERIGGRLVRTIQNFQRVCTFKLLDCPRLNAVSLPEGKVYVTRGLYERLTTDDLLAAAIAHELAHIAVQDGMSPRRSRETQLVKELAADARAIQYLNGANIDPHALLDLLQIVSDEQDPAWAKQRIAVLTDRLSTSSLSNAGSYRE
jgi:predicted Zn-dependent protease